MIMIIIIIMSIIVIMMIINITDSRHIGGVFMQPADCNHYNCNRTTILNLVSFSKHKKQRTTNKQI